MPRDAQSDFEAQERCIELQAKRIQELNEENQMLMAAINTLREQLGAVADRAAKFRRMPARDLATGEQ
jgi:septal ring factor EnvC (AmiA/AmiB activator)